MKRRSILQLAGLMATVAGCGGGGSGDTPVTPAPPPSGGTPPPSAPPPSPPPPPPPPPAPKNVLMISIDDLNDWVGFLGGNPQVKTPALDSLAARSTVFKRAYCTVPVCSASRASALTGLSPQSTGVYDLSTTFRAANPGKPMVDNLYASAGYTTKSIGKVDHTFVMPTQPLPSPIPYANKVCSFSETLESGAFDWGPAPGGDEAQPDYIFTEQAIDFLDAQPTDKPFFLAVGYVRTHIAWYVPQRFFDMYPKASLVLPYAPPDDLNDIGPAGQAIALRFNFQDCITRQDLWVDAVQAYLASISWADSQIGRLLAALQASPHAANTTIVLWSDHGFHLGEKFHWMKEALWEHATRVPFLLSQPGQTTSTAVDTCVSLQDMVPTLLDYTGVPPAYPLDGSSLRPLVDNPAATWAPTVLTTLNKLDYAVRTPDWRYIRYRTGEHELYDERADPSEITNLATDPSKQSVMAQLDALMPPRT